MITADHAPEPLEPAELTALATTLQREPQRSVAVARLGAARVQIPGRSSFDVSTLMERCGSTFVEAFLEHPDLTAGWFPLTETVYPWKLQADHLSLHAPSDPLRRWRAEYFGPLGTVQFEIRPTGQLICHFHADLPEMGRKLELARSALSRPRFPGTLQRVLARVSQRYDLTRDEREDHPSPFQAELVLPGNVAGAATAGSILDAFFTLPAPPNAPPNFDDIRWRLSSEPGRPLLFAIAADD